VASHTRIPQAADSLGDIPAHSRGWEGERNWRSQDAEPRLTAVHSRANTVLGAELRDGVGGMTPEWRCRAGLELDPGVFEQFAIDVRRVGDYR
jgi:hypothetical protein